MPQGGIRLPKLTRQQIYAPPNTCTTCNQSFLNMMLNRDLFDAEASSAAAMARVLLCLTPGWGDPSSFAMLVSCSINS